MDANEIWKIEGEIAAKAYDAFRKEWMAWADPQRAETGEETEACQRTFAIRWAAFRRDGA